MKIAGAPYENDGGARKLLQALPKSFGELLEDVQTPALSKGFWWET